MKHQDALAQLARETNRARRTLALERCLRAGFWVFFAVGVWTLIAVAGGHERLPFLTQSLSAITALIVFALLALRARRAFQAPSDAEARARLAEDSRLDLAAFESLDDHPSRYDPFAVALWRREQENAIEHVVRARSRGPRVRLGDIDRYQLRYVLLVALAVALVMAGAAAPDRIARAFLPDPGPLLGDQEMAVEAWVTAADYTHAAPVSLSERIGGRVETPPSVEATVRVTGPAGAPTLVFDGGGRHERVRFARAADGAWEARMAIPAAGRLRVVRFHTRAQWRIAPAADVRPQAAFSAPLSTLPEEHALISWRASDDFGVRRIMLRVRPVDPPPDLARADPIDTEIEAPAGDPREANAETEVDLAAHPYAGMEVEVRLVAVDALGQEGVSGPLRFTMPERVFLQPIALAALEIRRHLMADRRAYAREPRTQRRTIPAGEILLGNERIEVRDYDRRPALDRAPEGVRRAVRLIDALTMTPQDGYFRDRAVYLGLRLARSQVETARGIDATAQAAETLWRVALRAEYGSASDAEQAMNSAYMALLQALADNAPPERIRALTEALQRASERYMEALVQEAIREGNISNPEDTEEQATVTQEDLDDMIREVERLAQEGRMQEAAAMLAMHAMIMNTLQAQVQQQETSQSDGEGDPDQRMEESMDTLSQIMGEQRALRDETQQQDGQGGSGGTQQGGQGGDELAQRQAEIRQGLQAAQQMADDAGAAPSDDLNAAGEAMRRAEDALRRGDFESAEAAQSAALENLREGAAALAAEMRDRGRQGGQSGTSSAGRDPLGRELNGTGVGEGEGTVPTESDPVRAREIFDEIRRRAQDPNRSETEREYLRRLLDRFGDP